MKRAADRVACTVCVGAWCRECHEAIVSAFVETTLGDVSLIMPAGNDDTSSPFGVACPFCRSVFSAETVDRNIANKRTLAMLDAIMRCRAEIQNDFADNTILWLIENADLVSPIREKAQVDRDIAESRNKVLGFDCELWALHRDLACETDSMSKDHLSASIDELTMLRESEWHLISRLETVVESNYGPHSAYLNAIPRSDTKTTQVSDLLDQINPKRPDLSTYSVQAWDELLSPIGFFTFLHERVEVIHTSDIEALLTHMFNWFIRRQELQFLVDDVRRSCRRTSNTGIRRWLHNRPTCAVDASLWRDFNAQIRRCVEIPFSSYYYGSGWRCKSEKRRPKRVKG